MHLLNYYAPAAPATMFFFASLVIWSLFWKAIALWKAARNGSKAWYVILLLLNTAGILEIIYVYFFAPGKDKTVPASNNIAPKAMDQSENQPKA